MRYDREMLHSLKNKNNFLFWINMIIKLFIQKNSTAFFPQVNTILFLMIHTMNEKMLYSGSLRGEETERNGLRVQFSFLSKNRQPRVFTKAAFWNQSPEAWITKKGVLLSQVTSGYLWERHIYLHPSRSSSSSNAQVLSSFVIKEGLKQS